MKTNHTPGPWIYDAEAQCVVIEDRKGLHTCAEIDLSEVAHGGASFEEAEANARLIAAAPELLEEAQQLWKAAAQALAQLEKLDRGTANAIRAEFKDALCRQAIAKATTPQ